MMEKEKTERPFRARKAKKKVCQFCVDKVQDIDYKDIAKPIVDKIIESGKIPVICGGTGFYINSILYDLSYGNGKENPEVRQKYKDMAATYGNEYVFNVLKEKDPITADKLHFNDVKRVIRALEIYENGSKKSDIKDDFTPKYSCSKCNDTGYDKNGNQCECFKKLLG